VAIVVENMVQARVAAPPRHVSLGAARWARVRLVRGRARAGRRSVRGDGLADQRQARGAWQAARRLHQPAAVPGARAGDVGTDIVDGNNRKKACAAGFPATKGFDAVTGLGTPLWSTLSDVLEAGRYEGVEAR
tara:strand:+ start:72 stop:470 length:399 start_codon:yes stop_codon:yes gene_type:complete